MATAHQVAAAGVDGVLPPPSDCAHASDGPFRPRGVSRVARVALGHVDANARPEARVGGVGTGSGAVVMKALQAPKGVDKRTRGRGTAKDFSPSAQQASGRLPANIRKLHSDAGNLSLQGSVEGAQGKLHHTAVFSLVCIKGRIQHDGPNRGARVSADKIKMAQESPPEVLLLSADSSSITLSSHPREPARASRSLLS